MPNAVNQQENTVSSRPMRQLKTNRGLIRFILLSLITCGIYSIVYFSAISEDINTIAGRYDGKKTMHFCLICFLLGPITFEIATIVWVHNVCARIGAELKRRGIDYSFGAGTFWGWGVLGSLIVIGPFIYLHKLSVAMNRLAENYNNNG